MTAPKPQSKKRKEGERIRRMVEVTQEIVAILKPFSRAERVKVIRAISILLGHDDPWRTR